MKIGFPVLKKVPTNELEFDLNLHSSKLFGVFDTQNQSVKILTTKSIKEDGKDLIHFLKSESINFIISPEFHSMAARFFENNGIGVYKAQQRQVLTNIELFQQNLLSSFGAADAIKKIACSAKCNSCPSTCNDQIQDVVAI